MTPFLDALDDRVLVCDGAMGTLLYAQGIFINRCFDALNLTDPARVSAVHDAEISRDRELDPRCPWRPRSPGAHRLRLRVKMGHRYPREIAKRLRAWIATHGLRLVQAMRARESALRMFYGTS